MSRGYRAIIRHGLRRGLPSRAGFSRREFLHRTSLVAGAALATSLLGPSFGCASGKASPNASKGGSARSVVVVGAGFAGLAAADALREGGANVVVLEASSRPGGRVATSRNFIPGRPVEMGGEFIGENHPTWIALAAKHGVELEPLEESEGDSVILLDGKLIKGEQADALYEQVDEALAQLIERARAIEDPERPWLAPDAEALDQQSFADAVNAMGIGDQARQLIFATEEADNGVPPDQMSLLAYLSMVAGGGFEDYYELSETHRAKGGNDLLATRLADALGKRVRLNSAVVSIDRRIDGVTVRTNSGESYDADAVILAVAPSVWEKIKVTPAIDELKPQMGSNVKLLMSMSRPVWEEAGRSPDAVGDGLVNYGWVSAAAPNGRGPFGYTVFAGGRDSERLRSLSTGERTRQVFVELERAYPEFSRYASKGRFVDWPAMPRFLASYSFPAPGQITRIGPTLVDGPNDDLAPLLFAGEHTHYGFTGYMEGALQSGLRAANQILGRTPALAESAMQPVGVE